MPRTPKKVLGPYTRKPKLDPKKFKVGKAGPKSGKYAGKYVAKRIGPASTTPAPPAAPAGPYPEYADYPSFQQSMVDIDRAQQHHEGYVANTVMPWQSAALTGLQGFNQQAQDQLLAQLQGAGQGAFNAAAAAAPMGVAATTPGGVVAGPLGYLNQAQSMKATGMGSAAAAIGTHQAAMAKIQPTILAQGFVNQLADYARGLPQLYTEKRNERRAAIEQFIAEIEQAKMEMDLKEREFAFDQVQFAEELRSNRVDEAIRASNAETHAAIAFGNLGLRAEDLANDNAPPPMFGNLPPGFTQLPDGDIVRDPSYVPPAGAGGGSASTKYTRNWFLEKGWRQVPAKAGPATKARAIQGVDGSGLWIKPGSGAGGKPSANRQPVSDLGDDLFERYFGDDALGGGWEEQAGGDPKRAASFVVRWVLDNKASFMGANRTVNQSALMSVLNRIGSGAVFEHIIDILNRGYITPDGKRWRPT